MISPQEALRRWKANTEAAGESYKQGVQAVTDNPMALAAAAKDKWEAGVRRAAEEGRFEAGLSRRPASYWKERTMGAGARRFVEGVKDGAPAMGSHLANWLPHMATVKGEVDAMPSTTEHERDQRMLHQVRRAREFRQR